MLRQYFSMLLRQMEPGSKCKDILNSLLPGLIKEPQRVRVPVRRPAGNRRDGENRK